MNKRFHEERKEIDAATAAVGLDLASNPIELARMSRDAFTEGRADAAIETLASIPPVKLGRTVYRVIGGSPSYGLDLVGPRGGMSCLVRNLKNPRLWAHNTMSGHTCRSTWYRQNDDGSFSA